MAPIHRQPLSLVHRIRAPGVEPGVGSRAPLLLLLHGVGSNELSMAALAPAFDPRFVVISARAPITLEPFAFAWLHEVVTGHGPVIDPAEAAAARNAVTGFIDEAIRAYDLDPGRVLVAGFSQGGIVALSAMLDTPERITAVVCMSGRLAAEILPDIAAPSRLRGKPILIIHGSDDATLGVEHGRAASATLEALGLAVEHREFEMGHTTTDESVAVASAWLTDRLAP